MLVFFILTCRQSCIVSFENTFCKRCITLGKCVWPFIAACKLWDLNRRVNQIDTKKVDMYFSVDTCCTSMLDMEYFLLFIKFLSIWHLLRTSSQYNLAFFLEYSFPFLYFFHNNF